MKKKSVPVKKQNNNKLIIASLVFAIFVLTVFISTSKLSNLTGNAILQGGYSGTGYADPSGVFSLVKDNFTLISSNQTVTLQLQVNQPGGYIFKRGYVFNVALNDWVPFEFNEPTVVDSNWINGSLSVSKSLTINATDVLANGPNYVVTYSCVKVNGNWKCGCENANDTFCNKWMMQVFYVSNVDWTQNISDYCATDADCNFTFTGNKCKMGVCEFVGQCNATNSCSAGKVCNVTSQLCSECWENSDCASGNVCISQKCKNIIWKTQENANSYSYTGAYLYINYTVPVNSFSDSVWSVKHGQYSIYNITLPPLCWNSNNLILRFVSTANNGAGKAYSRPECYNGTGWMLAGKESIGYYDPAENVPCYSTFFIYDNNESTYSVYGYQNPTNPYACPDGWRFSPRAGYGYGGYGRIYEESMIWHLWECKQNSDCNSNLCIDSKCVDKCSSDAECYLAYGQNSYCSSFTKKCELMPTCNSSSKIGDICSGGIMINSTRIWQYRPLVYCPIPLSSTNGVVAKNYCDNLICGGYDNWTLPPVATFTTINNYWTDWGLPCTSGGWCSGSGGEIADAWCMKYI